MKLQPPEPKIPAENPYANDLFGRKEFGDSLHALFGNVEESLVVCVDAAWGDGKTTFAKMWMADLKHRKLNCIYYDAYADDYCEDPYVSFCAEIISFSESEMKSHDAIQQANDDFKPIANLFSGKSAGLVARMALKAATCGVIDASAVDGFKDVLFGDSAAVSDLGEKKLKEYNQDKENRAKFCERLAVLGTAVRDAQGFPLLIIVDELDRCRPTFALLLLERIKHLFEVPGVSFLLLVNMEQLERYVGAVYGAEVDARNYLHKFMTLCTKLPKNAQGSRDSDHSRYAKRLISHYGLPPVRELDYKLEWLFEQQRSSFREMERCFSVLSLYYSQSPNASRPFDMITAFLAFLWIRFPAVFTKLAASTASYEDVVQATGIERIPVGRGVSNRRNHLLRMLRVLLLDEDGWNSLDGDDVSSQLKAVMEHMSFRPRELIPFLCTALSKFTSKVS